MTNEPKKQGYSDQVKIYGTNKAGRRVSWWRRKEHAAQVGLKWKDTSDFTVTDSTK